MRTYIRQYVVLSDTQADTVTLWTAHTHAFDAAESTPYLAITSAEKRSGKTRLLEVLSLIVAHPWLTGRVSPAALYRRIHAERPTLLLDESDSAFKSGEEYGEPIAEDEDLFGTAVNLAARICSQAEAGQILAPIVVRELAAGKQFMFADLGETELRGFEDPVRLYELRWREAG